METNKYKILLIEDDKLDQMAFRRFVTNENIPYDFVINSSILQAKETLKNEKFDVIVTDYSLGDGTALDILDFIKDILLRWQPLHCSGLLWIHTFERIYSHELSTSKDIFVR